MQYEVVDNAEWEISHRLGSALAQEPYVIDLLAGKTIKIPSETYKRNATLYRLAKDSGRSIRMRSVPGFKLLKMVPVESSAAASIGGLIEE